jgi:Domain of unknown function (DUF1929)
VLPRSTQAAPKPPKVGTGQWSSVYPWPDVAIHLNYLPSGWVLSFSDDDHHDESRGADFSKAFMMDIPIGGAPSTEVQYIPNTTTNLFCAGHAFLPDGRLLVVGGHEGGDDIGSSDVNIFDRAGSHYNWFRQGSDPMNGGRWYPSAAPLASGEVVVVGGQFSDSTGVNPIPEVWQPNAANGSHWRELSTASKTMPLYSAIYMVPPNGEVYLAGCGDIRAGASVDPEAWFVTNPAGTWYLNTSGTGSWRPGPSHRLNRSREYGTSALYDRGKILVVGGGDPPTNTCEIIDLNMAAPAWQWTSPMQFARRQCNATILPDGKVLVTGGTQSGGFNDAAQAVLAAEMWDPATGRWSKLASMQVPRLYHATALLLRDGRVLSAGGGRPAPTNGVNNENAEIYSPPYLFKGSRPTISAAPAAVGYGQTFVVGTPDTGSIAKVTLVGLSAVSHCFNMNQCFSRLSFSQVSGGLSVVAPSSSILAPPGHYMLFILNGQGVPSVAWILQLS